MEFWRYRWYRVYRYNPLRDIKPARLKPSSRIRIKHPFQFDEDERPPESKSLSASSPFAASSHLPNVHSRSRLYYRCCCCCFYSSHRLFPRGEVLDSRPSLKLLRLHKVHSGGSRYFASSPEDNHFNYDCLFNLLLHYNCSTYSLIRTLSLRLVLSRTFCRTHSRQRVARGFKPVTDLKISS